MARKTARRKAALIANTDSETFENSDLLELKSEEISIDDEHRRRIMGGSRVHVPGTEMRGGYSNVIVPGIFLVLSVPEDQYRRKFGKIGACGANLPLLMANTEISHRVTAFLVVLALWVICVLDVAILEPFLSPRRSYATDFGCHTAEGCTRHAKVASDAFDDEHMPAATKEFKNNSGDDYKSNETLQDVDVKPDVTILEQTNWKNDRKDHVAIISSENRPVVLEKIKVETSDNESDDGGSSDDESENLGAVLTDEEMSSKEQDWQPNSSDSSRAEQDENQSDSDVSWNDIKSKPKKIRQKTETVAEPTAKKSKAKKSKQDADNYKGFICHYCEKRFSDKNSLNEHRLSRHERKKRPHKCPLCKFVSAYRRVFVRHLKNIHQLVKTKEGDYIEVPRQTVTVLPERKHTCDICGYKARWNAHLVQHQLTKHSQAKTFKCTFPGCNRSYKLKGHLRRHAKHHLLAKETRELAENAEDPWWRGLANEVPELTKCPEPGCYFETYCVGDLRVHSIAHSEEKKYVCDYPGCEFRSKWLRPLQEHELIHYPERGLACPVDGCEFRTACKRRLDYHGLSHSKNLSFPCDQEDCVFRGKTKESLRAHRRLVHKVNASYKCPHCPSRFCLPRTLHTHVKSHEANDTNTEERTGRHQCPECSKVCVSAYTLSSHMKKHAKEKQEQLKGKIHECSECSKVCKSAYHLRSHMKKHAKKKEKQPILKHECPECSKVCSTAYNLSSHMRVHLRKNQRDPEGQWTNSRRKQAEAADAEEMKDPVVIKVENEIKSEPVPNNALSLDTATVTQVVQVSVSNSCALLRELVGDS